MWSCPPDLHEKPWKQQCSRVPDACCTKVLTAHQPVFHCTLCLASAALLAPKQFLTFSQMPRVAGSPLACMHLLSAACMQPAALPMSVAHPSHGPAERGTNVRSSFAGHECSCPSSNEPAMWRRWAPQCPHHDAASRATAQALTWGTPGYLATARGIGASLTAHQAPASPGVDLVVCADCVYADQVRLHRRAGAEV